MSGSCARANQRAVASRERSALLIGRGSRTPTGTPGAAGRERKQERKQERRRIRHRAGHGARRSTKCSVRTQRPHAIAQVPHRADHVLSTMFFETPRRSAISCCEQPSRRCHTNTCRHFSGNSASAASICAANCTALHSASGSPQVAGWDSMLSSANDSRPPCCRNASIAGSSPSGAGRPVPAQGLPWPPGRAATHPASGLRRHGGCSVCASGVHQLFVVGEQPQRSQGPGRHRERGSGSRLPRFATTARYLGREGLK